MSQLLPIPLGAENFAPYGDVIDTNGTPDMIINQGICGRYHNLAKLDFADGKAGISLFHTEVMSVPFSITLMERHPLGSQAFIPMSYDPFIVVVAADLNDAPSAPEAFITQAGQAINIHRNVWHAPLLALHKPGLFAIVDRIGLNSNLEEFSLTGGDNTYQINYSPSFQP